MTMIEKIARAIAKVQGNRVLGTLHGGWFADNYWRKNIDDASAVLKAMREPTEVMWKAAAKTEGIFASENVWKAMIDAALNEKSEPVR